MLQLRIGLRPSGLRRQGLSPDSQAGGPPLPPGQPGQELCQGSRYTKPGYQPRPHPLPIAPYRWQGRRKMGKGVLGGGAGRHRRAHTHRHNRRSPRPSRVSRRQTRRRPVHRAGTCSLGRRWTQLSYQHLLVERPTWLCRVDGNGPPHPRPRQRQVHPAHELPPGGGALLCAPGPANRRVPGVGGPRSL